jgi:hypothetical protein
MHMTSDYPYGNPFVMAETMTGAVVCVVLTDDGTVRFHDAEGESFPGPVLAEYGGATFTEPSDGGLALDLARPETHIGPETFGVLRGWVQDEAGDLL